MDKRENEAPSTNGRRATIRDVARQAGVSPAAVSLTISGRGRIAEETRERIWHAIHDLNYRLPLRNLKSADRRHFTIPRGNNYHRGPVINVEEELDHLRFEVEQRQQEGFDILGFLPMLEQVYQKQSSLRAIEALYDRLELLTMRPDCPYVEPTTWASIESEMTLPAARPVQLDRDELLDQHLFATLDDVREATYWWMLEYNEERPHDSLGDRTPREAREEALESLL